MKIQSELTFAGFTPFLIDYQIVLGLSASARATFFIDSPDNSPEPKQTVAFDMGYTQSDSMQRIFLGYVESVIKIDNRHYKVFCRELSAMLTNRVPLSLRHCDLNSVLSAISDINLLSFSVPESAYSSQKIANFYNPGNGYQALLTIGKAFQIPDFCWFQQDDGIIYVGSYADTGFSDNPIYLDDNAFSDPTESGATLTVIPALRPGMIFNDKRVQTIELANDEMVIAWT
jgi:hypothetical protein